MSRFAKRAESVYDDHMHKSIRDYLPLRSAPKKMLVQARIDLEIVQKVKKVMKQEGLSWTKVLDALLRSFVDDRSQK